MTRKILALLVAGLLLAPSAHVYPAAGENHSPPLAILSMTAQPENVDRDIDRENSGADNQVKITIRARDNNGKTAIDNASGICHIIIFNPLNERVVDNIDISSTFTEIDENTGEWHYYFDPSNNSILGYYDVYVEIRDEMGNFTARRENRLFIVDDLSIELLLPFHSSSPAVKMTGIVGRLFGGSIENIDRVWIVEEDGGGENFGPVVENSFTRVITAGGKGLRQVTVYASWKNLDGCSTFGRWSVEDEAGWLEGEFENTWFHENLSLSLWSERKTLVTGLPSLTDHTAPAFGDVNKDNILELFVGQVAEGTRGFRWVENRWVEDFALTLGLPKLQNSAPALGDVDNDGNIDIILGWEDGGFKGFSWVDGRWIGRSNLIRGLRDVGSWSAPTLGDLTGDNRLELIAGSYSGYFYGFSWGGENWLENSALVLGLPRITGLFAHPCIADVDGDGRQDMIVGEQYDTRIHGFTWSGSAWMENENVKKGLGGDAWLCPAMADIDRNGKMDFIRGNKYGRLLGATWTGENWQDNENVVAGIHTLIEQSTPTLGDMNGDGVLELLSGDRPRGIFGYSRAGTRWVENSALVKGLPSITTLPTPALFDLHGDGVLELLVGNHQGILRGFRWNKEGENWEENSALAAGVPQLYDYIFPWVGDLDGDNFPELLLGKGQWAIYGFEWVENQWVENSALVNGISGLGMFPGPTVISLGGAKILIVASTNGFDGYLRVGGKWINVPFLVSGLGGGWPTSGDLDNDGLPEIITGSGYGTFYGFKLYPLCGRWTSPWYFIGEATHLGIIAKSHRRGIENLRITIETSDDALEIKQKVDAELKFGFAALEIQPGRYGRVTFYLQTPEEGTSPALSSFTLFSSTGSPVAFVGGIGCSGENFVAGVHENTRWAENSLTLEIGKQRGVWTSPWHDCGGDARFENFAVEAMASAEENIFVKVEISDDRSTIKGETEWLPVQGRITMFDLSELPRGRFLRVRIALETPTATPKVYSFSIGLEEPEVSAPQPMISLQPSPEATVLVLEPSSFEVIGGKHIALIATLKTSSGKPLAHKRVYWTATAGTFSPVSRLTDSLGQFSVYFLAPEIQVKIPVTVSAVFVGDRYYLGSKSTSVITVLPQYIEMMDNFKENTQRIMAEFEIGAEDNYIKLLENAFVEGRLGASMHLGVKGHLAQFLHPSVRVGVKEVLPGERIVLTVQSTENEKTIVVNIDNEILPGGELEVLLDGAPVKDAADYRDVLEATDENEPEYLILRGEGGVQVLVSIPYFSRRTITISTLPTVPLAAPPPALMLAGGILLAVVILAVVWWHISLGRREVLRASRRRRR